jgi:hypothetical protein
MVELEDFKYGGTNISAFRLIDPTQPEVQEVINDWVSLADKGRFGSKQPSATYPGMGNTLRVRIIVRFCL